MTRSDPPPSALSSLRPCNDEMQRAKCVIKVDHNIHLVFTHFDGSLALDLSFSIRSKSGTTALATLGRG
jgi:hypothetical protein